MDENDAAWFLPGESNQPAGPFTAEQVLDAWHAGKIAETTLCWREGLADWLPLTQVGVFSETIEVAKHDPSLVRFQCPNPQCSNLIIMALKFAGRQAKCQVCGQAVVVPMPDSPPASTPAESAPPPASSAESAPTPESSASPPESPPANSTPVTSDGVEVIEETTDASGASTGAVELPVFARAEEMMDAGQVAEEITACARQGKESSKALLCVAIVLALSCTGAVVSLAGWMLSRP